MKARFALLLVIALALPMVLSACGGDKVENAEKFLEAIGDRDADEAKEYACDDVHGEIDDLVALMNELDDFDVTDIECEEDGDNVKCTYTMVTTVAGETQSQTFEDEVLTMDGDKMCEVGSPGE